MKRKVDHTDILKAGLEIMYTKGYNVTGIKEIADATGILKRSFYNYFSSKKEFGKALLEYYKIGIMARMYGVRISWTVSLQKLRCGLTM